MDPLTQIESGSAYQRAVAKLLALGHELGTPRKFELEHMRVLAAELGHPERRFTSVLIAGTNGKGSTAATLASIVTTAGFRTGLYTSPHLVRVNERIRVFDERQQRRGDDAMISDPEFAEVFERVETAAIKLVTSTALPQPPSFFEMLTAMAFEYFASAGVEIAILEVGMGGRLDATNIVEPAVSVITDVDFDHQQFLGNTLPEIAREKAGIMRKDVPVVMLPQHPEANTALGEIGMTVGVRAVNATEYVPAMTPAASPSSQGLRNVYDVTVAGETVHVDSPLVGRHQLRNLALAVAAATALNSVGYTITPKNIERGIRDTAWVGRLQFIPRDENHPALLLDVAHNPAGAWALRSALSTYFDGVPLTLLFGAMRDKAIGEIGDILFPVAEKLILTQADSPRAATPQQIMDTARTAADAICEADPERAFIRACELTAPQGVLVISGSIYLVGAVLARLQSR